MATKLKPFRFWCQKVLPLVYDDSLSYYELLCKVVEYLNNTMTDVNKLAVDVEYIKNWFDNLDVQEEIDNKLDRMAADGTLLLVLNQFFKFAVTPQMYGAKGDGETDDTDAIQAAIDSGFPVFIPDGVYLTGELSVTDNVTVYGSKDSVLLGNEDYIFNINFSGSGGILDRYNFNLTIKDLTLNCNSVSNGIRLQNYLFTRFSGLVFKNIKQYGINIGSGADNGATCICDSIYIFNDTMPADSIGILDNNSDNDFSNVTIVNCKTGVQTYAHSNFYNLHVWNDNLVNFAYTVGVDITGNGCKFTACTFDTCRIGVKVRNGVQACFTNIRHSISKSVVPDEQLAILLPEVFNAGTSSHLMIDSLFIDQVYSNSLKMFNDDFYNALVNGDTQLCMLSNVFKFTSSSMLNFVKGATSFCRGLYSSNISYNFSTCVVNKIKRVGRYAVMNLQFQIIDEIEIGTEVIIGTINSSDFYPNESYITSAIPIGANVTSSTLNAEIEIKTNGQVACIFRQQPSVTSYRVLLPYITKNSLN